LNKQPPTIYTHTDTLGNLTGTWRYVRPMFSEKAPPCSLSCPAGNPVREILSLAAQGKFKEALEAIKKENPLPSVCGRVCPHPCTSACNRADMDEPIAINAVERFVGDTSSKHGLCVPEPCGTSGFSTAVVGSGPAGLSCAYQSALLGHGVTIFDSADKPGGLLRWGIPEYRLPREVLYRELGFIDELGIELELSKRLDRAGIEKLGNDFNAVCIATGAHQSARLSIPGEESNCVIPGLEFLIAAARGGGRNPGPRVVVIGGGNTAMDAARTALRLGASEVSVVYRRSREEMPAFEDEIVQALEEGVAIEFLASPLEIAQSNGRSAIVFNRMRLAEPDSSGRRRPVPIEGEKFKMDADTVIVATGENPDGDLLESFLPAGGGPSPRGVTPADNIFICGDAGRNVRTVAHAIGSGKRAAISMDAVLRGKDPDDVSARLTRNGQASVSAELYRTGGKTIEDSAGADVINTAHFQRSAALVLKNCSPAGRKLDFREVAFHPDEEAVVTEAGRCFSCGSCTSCGICSLFCPDTSILEGARAGRPDVDLDYCKGCGICARECPRGVIDMVEDKK